jgi:hypothetical protein
LKVEGWRLKIGGLWKRRRPVTGNRGQGRRDVESEVLGPGGSVTPMIVWRWEFEVSRPWLGQGTADVEFKMRVPVRSLALIAGRRQKS